MLKDIIAKTNIEKEKAKLLSQKAEQQAFVNKLLSERQKIGK